MEYALNLNAIDADLSQYFGVWAVEPGRFEQVMRRVEGINLPAHVASHREQQPEALSRSDGFERHERDGSIAVVSIHGVMTKYGSSLSSGGSMMRVRRELRAARASDDVRGVLLMIDSPGGTAAGTAELARDVATLAAEKPVYAVIEDLGASAAYWVASQATQVFANDRTALVGSIGTYIGLYDYSGAAEQEGIRAVVVKSGEFKGMGFPGTEITEDQVAVLQDIVDGLQSEFTASVAAGRGMSVEQAAALATGRVYNAPEAESMRLVDGIKSADDVLSLLQSSLPAPKGVSMTEKTEPVAATFEELVVSLELDTAEASDALFACKCLDGGLTIQQATSLRMKELKEARAAQPPAAGVPTVGTSADESESDADPLSDWNAALAKKMDAGLTRAAAVKRLAKERPELREAMLEAVNG